MRPSTLVMGAVVFVALGSSSATSSLVCTGVFEFEDGQLKGHFRCHRQGDLVRKARATCRDGQPGCDSDGACDGACRFSLCSDASCTSTFGVAVPLRRGGKAMGRTVLRSGTTKVILRCLPSRGACGPFATTSTVTTTTTTMLPSKACTVTLSGAVDASLSCDPSLSTSSLGLPVLRLGIDGAQADGALAALLVGRGVGTYRLGERMILVVARFDRPDVGSFQAFPGASGASAELRMDAVDGDVVHGTLDAQLPSTSDHPTLQVQAEF